MALGPFGCPESDADTGRLAVGGLNCGEHATVCRHAGQLHDRATVCKGPRRRAPSTVRRTVLPTKASRSDRAASSGVNMSEYPAAPPVSTSASAPAPPPPPPWWALIYWSVVGALTGLGLMAILTIGGYLLTAAMGMGLAVLAVPPLRSRAWPMAIAGIAAGPWFVAWLNRSGPGTVCWHTATEV